MSPQVDLKNWLNDDQVCAQLGISRRSLDREVEKKLWQPRTRPRAGRRPERVFAPEQVAARMPAPTSQVMRSSPDQLPPMSPDVTGLAELPEITWPAIMDFVTNVLQETQPEPQKRFVTAKQAGEIAGLSEGCIRRMMREGKLPFLTDHNAWLTSRDAVETFDPFAKSAAPTSDCWPAEPKKTRKRE